MAIAFPMPLAAPVIRATFPFNKSSNIIFRQLIDFVIRYYCKREAGLYAQIAVYIRLGIYPEEHGMHLNGISWHDLVFEAGLVYAGEKSSVSYEIVFNEQRAALSHNLTQYDPGHYGLSGKMSLEEELIAPDMILSDDRAVLLKFHLIHEQHRLAMA